MVNGSRLTGRMFKAAIAKYMAHRREVKHQKQQNRASPVTPHGKQTVKQLIGQNQGVSNIEINDPSLRLRQDDVVLKLGGDIRGDVLGAAPTGGPVFHGPERRHRNRRWEIAPTQWV